MTENSRATAATITGAIIGGMAGYLLFTDRGRELRRQFEPALDDFVRELNNFRNTFEKAAGVAGEGWKLLNEAMAETGSRDARYPAHQQSSPF